MPAASPAVSPAIRTPDQRVRVFISLTLQELSEERRADRDAVTTLRLVPVMFELGARPHRPRRNRPSRTRYWPGRFRSRPHRSWTATRKPPRCRIS